MVRVALAARRPLVKNDQMRLVEFRVRAFRNVLDSRRVPVEPDITCLVGKNESGKTALLEALVRTKPSVARPLDPAEHYPRWLLTRDRKVGAVEQAAPVEAQFALDGDDEAAVAAHVGPGVLRSRTFSFGLRYGGPYAAVELDGNRAVRNLLDRAGVSDDARAALAEAATPEELRKLVAQHRDGTTRREEPTPEPGADAEDQGESAPQPVLPSAEDLAAVEAELLTTLGEDGELWAAVVGLLDERMPTFIYFDDFAILPGRVDLELLADEDESGPEYLNTARALLHLAGADAEALLDDAYEERRAELEAVSNNVTEQVFQFWTQDQDLAVEIDVDHQTVPRGAARDAVVKYLDVRVRDRRRGFSTNFGQRSAGFQWFFSFLAAASAFDRYPHGVVVLLDEPALTLHPAGQADLLRFIEERIAPAAQVIYTTHSPFMVNPAHPQRLRMVEDRGPEEGAVVLSNAADALSETLAPLQTVLGLDLARSLFDRDTSLVVRAPADLTYLTIMSDRLARRGRAHLDPDWRLLPAGDAAGVPIMLTLLGQAPGVTVLLDGPVEAARSQHSTEGVDPLSDHRIVSLADLATTPFATVEDLFTEADYLRLHNGAFGTRLRPVDLVGDGPILDRVAAATGIEDIDRQAPAAFLVQQRRSILRRLSKESLARFEALFEKINATLP
jgi:predicted ATPase